MRFVAVVILAAFLASCGGVRQHVVGYIGPTQDTEIVRWDSRGAFDPTVSGVYARNTKTNEMTVMGHGSQPGHFWQVMSVAVPAGVGYMALEGFRSTSIEAKFGR